MTSSFFAAVEMAPRDPILGLTEAFNADTRPNKVNLGVGVYLDDNGKVPLLSAVRRAEKARLESLPPRSYQPIDGPAAFSQTVQRLLFGEGSPLLAAGRVLTCEALGGTGALKVGADYLRRLLPQSTVFISDPSWENHRALFEYAGFPVASYAYYDPTTRGVDFAAMKASLAQLPPESIVVLHACCHNPTGADLEPSQWAEIIELVGARRLLAFVDFAYQGFADSLEEDALPVRLFAESGLQFLVAGSFSKSFSLYGERVGSLSVVTANRDETMRVLSQIKRVIRTNYSNPPTHGGAIVAAILADGELARLWEEELAGMRARIRSMRSALVDELRARGVQTDLSFITRQRGMFSYTGLSAAQVDRLREEFAIYAVSSGRICVAALNTRNIGHVADAMAAVL
ncbi:MAG TPA: amino acid aminotransferase [Accumulibacter sp.]|uniref:amino acid aminotransferase n=1 Tax=Accumulibacter sp. TaxID=2053492 RepID=UPI002CCF5DD8|nr:amino acid aminotransferase [Accumulibacter sp.]HNL98051.1 amino acid aminotransferase [Accumulibacter sp.]